MSDNIFKFLSKNIKILQSQHENSKIVMRAFQSQVKFFFFFRESQKEKAFLDIFKMSNFGFFEWVLEKKFNFITLKI